MAVSKWSVCDREIFPSSNEWGIPDLIEQETTLPERTAFDVGNSGAGSLVMDRTMLPSPGSTIGFYVDDVRIESLWSWPTRGLRRIERLQPAAVLEPDFSQYEEMPRVAQIWNLYRQRWIGRWWQEQGLTVIPSLAWSSRTLECLAAGIPRGSDVVCECRPRFKDEAILIKGLKLAAKKIKPRSVLLYGADEELVGKLPKGPEYRILPAWSPKKRMLYSPSVASWMCPSDT